MKALLLLLLALSSVEGLALPGLAAEKNPKADEAGKKKALETSRKLIVEAGIAFKSFDRNAGIDDDEYYHFNSGFGLKDTARNRQRWRLFGVQVSTSGDFVLAAMGFDWKHVESVAVYGVDGKESLARPVGVSRHGRLLWFHSDALARTDLPEAKRRPLPPGTEFLEVQGGFRGGRRSLTAVPLTQDETVWLEGGGPRRRDVDIGESKLGESVAAAAVFSKDGEWLGVDPERPLLEADGSLRVHPADLAADRIDWEVAAADGETAAKRLEARLTSVQLRFRLETGAPSPGDFMGNGEQLRAIKERTDAGIPVGKDLVFVPNDLDRDLVRRLESATVVLKGESRRAAFVGVTRELEGYLLRLDKALPAAKNAPAPEDGTLFLAYDVRWFGGHVDLRQRFETFDGTAHGYNDAPTRWAVVGQQGKDALLSTLEGEPFGVALRQRRYESEPEKESWREPRPLLRVYTFDELAAAFKTPEAAIDPLLQPRPLDVVKRKPWLGVETQGLTPDLAKLLKIERETLDGTRGQLITFVYPGSPAEKLKLAPGDLLLKLRDSAKKDEVPLPAEGESTDEISDGRWWRTWFIRKTPVTETLGRFGVGSKVELTYAHAGSVKTEAVTLTEGPPDFEGAPKYKAPRTGLTLKDLTYDVRNILRLQEQKGVLVYDVDSGSPANIAEIDPMDIVTAVDNRAVADLAAFKQILEEEQAKGTESVRLRIRYLNDTRFADLRFSAPTEKDDGAASVMDDDVEESDEVDGSQNN